MKEKPSPRIVYRFGKQDKDIKEFQLHQTSHRAVFQLANQERLKSATKIPSLKFKLNFDPQTALFLRNKKVEI